VRQEKPSRKPVPISRLKEGKVPFVRAGWRSHPPGAVSWGKKKKSFCRAMSPKHE
jgi:hypothetical protein